MQITCYRFNLTVSCVYVAKCQTINFVYFFCDQLQQLNSNLNMNWNENKPVQNKRMARWSLSECAANCCYIKCHSKIFFVWQISLSSVTSLSRISWSLVQCLVGWLVSCLVGLVVNMINVVKVIGEFHVKLYGHVFLFELISITERERFLS